jgi:hypothetical protein
LSGSDNSEIDDDDDNDFYSSSTFKSGNSISGFSGALVCYFFFSLLEFSEDDFETDVVLAAMRIISPCIDSFFRGSFLVVFLLFSTLSLCDYFLDGGKL